MRFKRLFEPINIGSVRLKNRIIMMACATNYGSSHGEVTKQMVEYYSRKAKGGVGVIIVEDASIDFPMGIGLNFRTRLYESIYSFFNSKPRYFAMKAGAAFCKTTAALPETVLSGKVVMAIGVEPDNGLEEELRRRISAEIYSVGDCEEDGNKKIGRAIYSATRVAYKI